MTIFDLINAIGGLCLFLFGMKVMGESLERSAGYKLRVLIRKITGNKITGFFVGAIVTAILQSSGATTVMCVGFVSSGIMTLSQAVCVIIGANVGTTATAWLLSLNSIGTNGVSLISFLKPEVFSPILGLLGVYFFMFCKKSDKKDIGAIILGFMALMIGMSTMTKSLSGLAEIPQFKQVFQALSNPFLGVLVGAGFTALLQSSSASIGILQALAATGQVTYSSAVPILMGSNIGSCVTTLISSIGSNSNARRASCVHLTFNTIGTILFMILYCVGLYIIKLPLLQDNISLVGIAVVHTLFNVGASLIFVPLSSVLEKIAIKLVKEDENPEEVKFDERLYDTPAIALERAHNIANEMAESLDEAVKLTCNILSTQNIDDVEKVVNLERKSDSYEDTLNTVLVKISSLNISDDDSLEIGKLMKSITDFERIGDHCRNLAETAASLSQLEKGFSEKAKKELCVIVTAVSDVYALANNAFLNGNLNSAYLVEPLEEVVDELTVFLRDKHTQRLQKGECSIETGVIWNDMLTNLERISDHCSNIALSVIDATTRHSDQHKQLKEIKSGGHDFKHQYDVFHQQYRIPEEE